MEINDKFCYASPPSRVGLKALCNPLCARLPGHSLVSNRPPRTKILDPVLLPGDHLMYHIEFVIIEESEEIWNYQRYELVSEYALRAPLPVPFNVIYEIPYLLIACVRSICCLSPPAVGKYNYPTGVTLIATLSRSCHL